MPLAKIFGCTHIDVCMCRRKKVTLDVHDKNRPLHQETSDFLHYTLSSTALKRNTFPLFRKMPDSLNRAHLVWTCQHQTCIYRGHCRRPLIGWIAQEEHSHLTAGPTLCQGVGTNSSSFGPFHQQHSIYVTIVSIGFKDFNFQIYKPLQKAVQHPSPISFLSLFSHIPTK